MESEKNLSQGLQCLRAGDQRRKEVGDNLFLSMHILYWTLQAELLVEPKIIIPPGGRSHEWVYGRVGRKFTPSHFKYWQFVPNENRELSLTWIKTQNPFFHTYRYTLSTSVRAMNYPTVLTPLRVVDCKTLWMIFWLILCLKRKDSVEINKKNVFSGYTPHTVFHRLKYFSMKNAPMEKSLNFFSDSEY